MSWIERATANLLQYSTYQGPGQPSFTRLMHEWEMTDGFNDLEDTSGICELCDHPDIRYQYEVRNRYMKIHLWVGSTCILQFVPLYEDYVEVTDPEDKARLLTRITTRLINEARERRAIRLIGKLAEIDDRFTGSNWERDWKKGYSVKQLQMIAIGAKKAGFTFKAADFQINTKRGRYVEQARELELWQYQQLRPAFTTARQKELDQYFGLA